VYRARTGGYKLCACGSQMGFNAERCRECYYARDGYYRAPLQPRTANRISPMYIECWGIGPVKISPKPRAR